MIENRISEEGIESGDALQQLGIDLGHDLKHIGIFEPRKSEQDIRDTLAEYASDPTETVGFYSSMLGYGNRSCALAGTNQASLSI